MNKTANRWHAARAVSCLPALTGNLGRPGAGMGPRHGAKVREVWYNAFGKIIPPDRKAPETAIVGEMETILKARQALLEEELARLRDQRLAQDKHLRLQDEVDALAKAVFAEPDAPAIDKAA